MAKKRNALTQVISGSADGEIIYWNLSDHQAKFTINAHSGFLRGLTFSNNHELEEDTIFLSSGDDKKVCLWSLN